MNRLLSNNARTSPILDSEHGQHTLIALLLWQFHGKTIDDVVAFMKQLPEDRDVEYHYFAVLGDDFVKRRLVTIWRMGDEYLEGDELDALPCSVAGECCDDVVGWVYANG